MISPRRAPTQRGPTHHNNNGQQLWPPSILTLTLTIFTSTILTINESNTGGHVLSRAGEGLCRKGWFHSGQKCYKLYANSKNFNSAKTKCIELSSSLAFIDDVESNKEEEFGSSESISHNNKTIQGLLDHLKAEHERKPDIQSRHYYVNISQDLYEQFLERKRRGYYSENSSLQDDNYFAETPVSNLWLSNDDPVQTNLTLNLSSLPDSEVGFVLTYSHALRRVGLVPVNANKKFSEICEMNLSHPPHTPKPGHQMLDPRREPHHSSSSNNSPENTRTSPNPILEPASFSRSEAPPTTTTSTTPSPELSSVLFREFPQDLSIVLGSTAEFRCSALDAESNLVWTFNDKNLTQSNRVRVHPNGTLRIEHVRNVDSGTYTCSISSGNVHESKNARLEIIQRPLQPEYITAELLDKLSTSVRIKWTPGFNGNSPILKYQAEMKTVSEDDSADSSWQIAKANISADLTSVIIPDLKPARSYVFRIKATNRVGTSDASQPTSPPIEVPVQPPSMPPENLTGTPKTSTSIILHWSPPPADSQNGVIKGYKIRHKLAGYAPETDWYTSSVPETTHLSYVLDDLIVWQNYEIQIAAENDKGPGPYSSGIIVRTKEGKPDLGPRMVSAEATSSKMIKVSWRPPPPQHINGVNQGYRVYIYLDPQLTQLSKETVVPHNTSSFNQTTSIDELLPYTQYYISVKCFTSAGDGPSNDELVKVKTKEDFPEAVPTLEFADVLDKSLRLIWKPPIRINGELVQYSVEYSETGYTDKKILKTFSPETTEAKIYELRPQTPYTFKIFPHTRIGSGPGLTSSVTTSVPPVLPEPPSNLVVSNVGAHSVTIQFKPGFDGNANIEKWVAEALTPSRSEFQARWQHIYTSTNHTQGNTVVIRNLQPFTRYSIRLSPVNVVGKSTHPSEASREFQTAQTEPEQPPRDLSIEDVRQNSVVAHWSPLSNNLWLGNPVGYNITWSESNSSTLMYQFIRDTRADSCLIKDLEEYTEYSFRIHAVNEAGPSPASEPITVTTLEDVPSAGPTNLTVQPLSSTTVSVNWNQIPKRHRNGVIKGYRIQYQAVKADAQLLHKTVEDGSARHVTLNDLKPHTNYKLAIAGYTNAGDGVFSSVLDVQTLEDTPGKPQNLTFPTVSQTSTRVLWDPPEDPNGDIIGYKVSWYSLIGEESKDVMSQELHATERTFKANNLKPDTPYMFIVTAKTKEGWGQQNSQMLYTYDSQLRANLPFYKETWFVILCACLMVLITIIVTALLFVQTKGYKYKQDAMKSTSQDRLGDAGFTLDDEANSHYNNGFGLLTQNAHHRRSNGALSQSTANFTLPKSPPRPHPGSVVYSDEGDDDVFEDVVVKQPHRSVASTSHQDSSGDSLTEKPSEISSSTAPDSESADDEYINMANKHFVNHYANVNGTLRGQKNWKKHNKTSSHRTKPQLPHRPAPSVPQVPGEPSSSSSEANFGRPIAGSSGMAHQMRPNGTIYGESQAHKDPQQPPQPNTRNATMDINTSPVMSQNMDVLDGANINGDDEIDNGKNQNTQQTDLLNSHIMSLNGGRIIVDNMAGSRAPLPGFTSFV